MAKGRPPKFVDQRTGKPVKGNGVPLVGLSLHKNGTYYATGTKPRVYFGKDFGLAKAQFRQWQHRHEGPTAADVKEKTGADRDKALFEFSRWHQDHPGEYMTFTAYSKEDATEHVLQIPSQAVWDRMHDLFFENPAKFAENIRVPAMANLDHLKKPAPSLNLDAVGTMYLDRTGKPLNFRWRRDCKGYWEEFCKLTACKTLADLDADSVAGYREAIYQARNGPKTTRRSERSPHPGRCTMRGRIRS